MARVKGIIIILLLVAFFGGCNGLTDISTTQTDTISTISTTDSVTLPPTTNPPTTVPIVTSTQIITTESALTVQLRQIYILATDSGSFSGTYEEWLESVRGPEGEAGKEVLMRVAEGNIQWRHESDLVWNDLVPLLDLMGTPGVDGKEVELQVSGNYIQWRYQDDLTWENLLSLDLLMGNSGEDGHEVEFYVSTTHIQYRYTGDETWVDLIALSSLIGPEGAPGQEVVLQVGEGYIRWQYEGEVDWHNLIEVATLVGATGAQGEQGEDGLQVEFYVSSSHIQYRYTGDDTWVDLIALSSLIGPQGAPGQEVVLQVGEGFIRWQYEGETAWNNLIELATLVGPAGQDGINGVDGKEVAFRVDSNYIQWQYLGDDTWTNLISLTTLTGADGLNGSDGADGREVEFRVDSGYIQWRYEDEITWNNLIELATLVGPAGQDGINGVDGKEVTFRVDSNYIQWQYLGDDTWTSLIALSTLTGPQGVGIASAVVNAPGELVITYTDATVVNLGQLLKVYQVVFKDYNGYVLSVQHVLAGNHALAPIEPSRNGYAFTGWDETYTDVIADLEINATYAKQSYTVVFYGFDGTPLKTESVLYLDSATAPAAPDIVGKSFSGWSEAYTEVKEDLAILAQYTDIVYQIDFYDYNGSLMSSQAIVHGEDAVAPAAPSRDGYDFAGWDQVYTNITISKAIYATYAPKTYTITYYDREYDVITTQIVDHGTDGTPPVTPDVIGYHFIGWDKAALNVVRDLDVIALYNINIYEVIFRDANGSVFNIQHIEHGQDASNPGNPNKTGWNFTGWDEDYLGVTGDLDIEPLFAQMSFTVSFFDEVGDPIEQQAVLYGEDASDPYFTEPTLIKVGYDFLGWSQSIDNIDSDRDCYPLYEIQTFQVVFRDDDGSVFDNQSVTYGDDAYSPLTPTRAGHDFAGWDSVFTYVTADMTVTATYTIHTFAVNFYDLESNILKTEVVDYLASATPPVAPSISGYDFIGWDDSYSEIVTDVDLWPVYQIKTYQVTFYNHQGGILSLQTVEHDTDATAPTIAARTGYTFLGWDQAYAAVQADLEIHPTYSINTYDVLFDENGGSLVSDHYDVEYNTIIVLEIPNKLGYKFLGWYLGETELDQKFYASTPITEDISLYARWELASYDVTFVDHDDTILRKLKVGYGYSAIAPDDPSRVGYTFTGWDTSYLEVTDDLVICALYTPIDYLLALEENGGDSLSDFLVPYETLIPIVDTPVRTGYTFMGWYKDSELTQVFVNDGLTELMALNGMTIYAKWQINQYTISFEENGGSEVSDITQDYNSTVTEPAEPFRTGYTFNGWYIDTGLSVSYEFTVMPAYDDVLYADWMINQYQLSYYDENARYPATDAISLLAGETIVQTAVGDSYTIVLTSNGRVLTWGSNDYGQLGDGTTTTSHVPLDITSQFSLASGEVITMVSSGAIHSAAITSLGRIFTWGYDGYGQLGNPLVSQSSSIPGDITAEFSLASGELVTYVDLGLRHSSAITSDGRVFMWGDDTYGQLGNDSPLYAESTPGEINSYFILEEGETIVSTHLGALHSAALSSMGRVFTWGYNNNGQLGNNSSTLSSVPIDITAQFGLAVNEGILSLYIGDYNTSVTTDAGRVFIWGNNSYGKIGDGSTVTRYIPIDVTMQFTLNEYETIVSLDLSTYRSMAISSEGRVFCWGGDNYGYLFGSLPSGVSYSTIPLDLTDNFTLPQGEKITASEIGSTHFYVLTSKGRIYLWGNDSNGEIGDGLEIATDLPKEPMIHYAFILNKAMIYDYNSSIVEYIPSLEGHTFNGWYTDMELTNPYSFGTMPAADLNLYGDWTLNQYTVYFEENGGSNVDDITLEYTAILEIPLDPFKTGYSFVGWFADAGFEDEFAFETMPSSNLTLYAKWKINQYPIYYDIESNDEFTDILPLFAGEKVIQISSGSSHSIALTSIGRVFAWGRNYYGQLGIGTTIDQNLPIEITKYFQLEPGEIITTIATTKYYSSAALSSFGRIFTWGYNDSGNLGDTTQSNRYFPVDITSGFGLAIGETIIDISLGNNHSMAISSNGRVFGWGSNEYGQFGNGSSTTVKQLTPLDVTAGFAFGATEKFIKISLGNFHSLGLTSEGRLLSWGRNNEGQLGDSTSTNKLTPVDINYQFALASGEEVVDIAAGEFHSGAITSLGRIYMWGDNDEGQLGNGLKTTFGFVSTPIDTTSYFTLESGDKLLRIYIGQDHTGTISEMGHVYVFGVNTYSQVGSVANSLLPTDVTDKFALTSGESVIEFALGYTHSVSLTSLGEVQTWGSDSYGQLGDGTVSRNYSLPYAITEGFACIPNEVITKVISGYNHAAALTSWGRILMWGDNSSGQLGDNTTIDKVRPIDITSMFTLLEEENIVDMALGGGHSFALTSLGRLFAWGNNSYGQLGIGSTTNQLTPIEITFDFELALFEQIILVATGERHSAVVTSEGRIFTWGSDSYYQLGDGNVARNQTLPYEITSLFGLVSGETVTTVQLGTYHSVALTSAGRIFTWGRNNYGELGDDTTVHKELPTDITLQFTLESGEEITAIFAGGRNTAAITSMDKVYIWGDNSFYEIGDTTMTGKLTPFDITTYLGLDSLEGVTTMAIGNMHVVAITSNGRALAWGYNESGQIGNGTTGYGVSSPLDITSNFALAFGEGISAIDLGTSHSLALSSLGQIFGWGLNTDGQLGTGNLIQYTLPVKPDIYYQANVDKIEVYDFAETIIPYLLSRTGYTFSGWYLDTDFAEAYIFGEMPAEAVHLFAKWTINQYTISFEENDGSTVEDITADYASSVTAPTDPTRTAYTFIGWYQDAELTITYEFTTMPAEDITIYAKWTNIPYTISFEENGGPEVTDIVAFYNESVSAPDDPEREGYTFIGWFADSGLTTPYIFTTMPLDGTTVYLKWEINEYDLSFYATEEYLNPQFENGDNHSLLLTQDERLYAVGNNAYGQLGNGTFTNTTTKIDITDLIGLGQLEGFLKIVAAYHVSFVLTSDGRLLGTGINNDGQLGTGDLVNRNVFTDITANFNLEVGEMITDVFSGGLTTFVLTSEGRIFGFGDNYVGSVGDGTSNNDRTLPVDITAKFPLEVGETIVSIEVGRYHAYAITSDNRIFSWGKNESGQLGIGTSVNQSLPIDITANFPLEEEDTIVMVSSGFDFGIAVSESGRVFTWGYNYYGMLGVNYTGNIYSPREITTAFYLEASDRIIYVTASEYNGQAISESGRIYSWGYGSYYVNGNGSSTNYHAPYEITAYFKLFYDEVVLEIEGYGHSMHAITSEGRIFVWGSGGYGVHFDGITSSKSTPVNVVITDLDFIEEATYDYDQTLIYPEDPSRDGYTFGGWYQDLDYLTPFAPSNMPAADIVAYAKWIPNERTITFVINGGSSVASITKNYQEAVSQPANPTKEGYLFKGWYEDEELSIPYRFVHMEDRDLTLYAMWEIDSYDLLIYDYQEEIEFSMIAVGYDHILALTNSGQLFAWGDNAYGQLGNGSQSGSTVPIDISGYLPLVTGETIVGIYAGDDCSAILTSEGRMFTWGYNTTGAVGLGTSNSYYNTPQDITGMLMLNDGETIELVFVNRTNMHVVTSDGRVLAWGGSEMTGAYGERRRPYDITPYFNFNPGETIVELEGAGRYIMALTSDDRIFGWGYDGYSGAFGSGSYYFASAPVDFTASFIAILDGETFIDLEACDNNMIGLTSSGRLIGWGYNSYGELLDGTTIKRDYPIDMTPFLGLSVGEDIDHLGAGWYHVVLLTTEGRMLTWGRNDLYQLGTLTTVNSLVPVDVTANMPISDSDSIYQVMGRSYSTFVLTDSGELIRFGYNSTGILGDGTTTTKSVPAKLAHVAWKMYDRYRLEFNDSLPTLADPTKYENNFDGWFENAALTTPFTTTNMPSAKLSIYGKWIPNQYTISFETNGGGVIADRTFDYDATISMPADPTKQGYTFAGWFTDAALTEPFSLTMMPEYDFTLYAEWTINVYNITYYYDNETIDYTQVSTGGMHTIALTDNGQVFTWGYNAYGQLGNGTTSSNMIPQDITANFYLYEGESIIYVYALSSSSSALSSFGRVFSWGYNTNGQVGDNTTTHRNMPVDITSFFSLEAGEMVISIYKARNSAYALTSDDRIFSWGSNSDGMLGVGDSATKLAPQDITARFNLETGETITLISGGNRHVMAISSEGRVFAWGYNSGTQYVFAATTPSNTTAPIDITANLNLASGETLTFIAAGDGQNYAITSLGKLLAWGYAELGDGSTTSSATPIDLTVYLSLDAGETIEQIQVGSRFVVVLTSLKRILTFGVNNVGQLGDGTTVKKLLPVDITAQFTYLVGETIESLFTGYSSNSGFALSSEGRIFAWGHNDQGVLGDNTITNRTTPIVVSHTAFSYLSTNQFDYQEALVLIADPEKAGYDFVGWYTDPGETQLFTLTNMPSNHLKLYAKWTLTP